MRKAAPWFGLSAVIVMLDQLSKIGILATLGEGQSIAVWPPFFSLVLAWNPGAAFSFLASESGWQRWFFVVIAVAASVLIGFMLVKHARERFLCTALALVLGGALGNLIDRVVYGAVVDFLLVRWPGGPSLFDPWPAFNIADSCISVGAVLLILDSFRRSKTKSSPGAGRNHGV
jgi:signal peptidase II